MVKRTGAKKNPENCQNRYATAYASPLRSVSKADRRSTVLLKIDSLHEVDNFPQICAVTSGYIPSFRIHFASDITALEGLIMEKAKKLDQISHNLLLGTNAVSLLLTFNVLVFQYCHLNGVCPCRRFSRRWQSRSCLCQGKVHYTRICS